MQIADIEKLRKEIRSIDQQLIDILLKRLVMARELGRVKQANGIEIYQPNVEDQHRALVLARIKSEVLDDQRWVLSLFEQIIAHSRLVQSHSSPPHIESDIPTKP